MTAACAVCGNPESSPCGGCGGVWYCGKQGKRKRWTSHKQECSAFKIVREEGEHGRSLVASRDLKAGERIMLVQPMCVGPRLVDPAPCCLGNTIK